MKRTIPILTWQEHHEAVPLRFIGTASAASFSAYDGQSARAADSMEGEAMLRITLRSGPGRPTSAIPEQVRKSLRPPWWA